MLFRSSEDDAEHSESDPCKVESCHNDQLLKERERLVRVHELPGGHRVALELKDYILTSEHGLVLHGHGTDEPRICKVGDFLVGME